MPFVNRTHPHARGLVGYWLMNEGTGNKVADLSGNGVTGVFYGHTQFGPAKYGPGLVFDGTGDFVKAALPAARLGGANPTITVVAWIYPTNVTAEKHVAAQKSSQCFLMDGKLYLYGVNTERCTSTTTFVTNRWYQIAYTISNGATCALYVNGIKEDTGTWVDEFTDDFYIGAWWQNEGENFAGTMDHVLVFNRSFSDSNIADLYTNPFQMFERPTPELWVEAGGEPPAGNPQFITIIMSRLPAWLAVGMIITVLAVAMGCDVNKGKAA